MKSNLIASLVTCWTNTSLKSLNPTGKCYIQTRFQHFVVVFKTQKTPTTLQVKMYSNGCQNAQWEWLLGSGRKCWQYLGKCEFGEAGLAPHVLLIPMQGRCLLQNFWFELRKQQAWTDQWQPQQVRICTLGLHRWLCQENLDDDSQHPLPQQYPIRRDPAFSIQPLPLRLHRFLPHWVLVSWEWRNFTPCAGMGSI